MITDEKHPEFQRATVDFQNRMRFFDNWPVTEATLQAIERMIVEHRDHWKLQGVEYPPLVVICLPRCDYLYIRHAELQIEQIRDLVVHLATKARPTPTAEEIAFAIGHAYPKVRGGKLMEMLQM